MDTLALQGTGSGPEGRHFGSCWTMIEFEIQAPSGRHFGSPDAIRVNDIQKET